MNRKLLDSLRWFHSDSVVGWTRFCVWSTGTFKSACVELPPRTALPTDAGAHDGPPLLPAALWLLNHPISKPETRALQTRMVTNDVKCRERELNSHPAGWSNIPSASATFGKKSLTRPCLGLAEGAIVPRPRGRGSGVLLAAPTPR